MFNNFNYLANVCSPNPCGPGSCVQTGLTTAVCRCPFNFLGFLCEIPNPCQSNPCFNKGSCSGFFITKGIKFLPQYKCTCLPCFTGKNCEINNINKCTLKTCQNGGTCMMMNGKISCSCPIFYTGHLLY